ncbi:MAG: archaeosine biosynthesis radical SAM protein RaSEA [Promethearchaeota archaeon]
MGKSHALVLGTKGCRWALGPSGGCFMCGYSADVPASPPSPDELLEAFRRDWAGRVKAVREEGTPVAIKIYTSGSFLDPQEVPPRVADEILSLVLSEADAWEVVVETRAEHVNEEVISRLASLVADAGFNPQPGHPRLELGVGLESADDRVREACVNKGLDWGTFEAAARTCRKVGLGVKCYLLFKPPFLDEAKAIDDLASSVVKAAELGVTTVSVNPTSVHRATVVEWLYSRGAYRPGWVLSLLAALLEATRQLAGRGVPLPRVLCAPTGPGKPRGVHDCLDLPESSASSLAALGEFVRTQDPAALERALSKDGDCHRRWADFVAVSRYLARDLDIE